MLPDLARMEVHITAGMQSHGSGRGIIQPPDLGSMAGQGCCWSRITAQRLMGEAKPGVRWWCGGCMVTIPPNSRQLFPPDRPQTAAPHGEYEGSGPQACYRHTLTPPCEALDSGSRPSICLPGLPCRLAEAIAGSVEENRLLPWRTTDQRFGCVAVPETQDIPLQPLSTSRKRAEPIYWVLLGNQQQQSPTCGISIANQQAISSCADMVAVDPPSGARLAVHDYRSRLQVFNIMPCTSKCVGIRWTRASQHQVCCRHYSRSWVPYLGYTGTMGEFVDAHVTLPNLGLKLDLAGRFRHNVMPTPMLPSLWKFPHGGILVSSGVMFSLAAATDPRAAFQQFLCTLSGRVVRRGCRGGVRQHSPMNDRLSGGPPHNLLASHDDQQRAATFWSTGGCRIIEAVEHFCFGFGALFMSLHISLARKSQLPVTRGCSWAPQAQGWRAI
ncbi:hypothetical protein QBC40DRAFT_295537 [Triangularia verruculosa]|uniref:Uncharacterized protein n=1 Tax=Triangularia verruculosa TaxID=2587418 RepID=A0AAN7AW35_9PEZI|nr:hypothetical protein QBC40DRAFT_295537 [Triangularia verruculosa]